MKTIKMLLLMLVSSAAFSQTFPVNNLSVNGNAMFAGSMTINGSSANGLIVGGGSGSPIAFVAPGTTGFFLQSNGASLAPSWVNLSATFAPLNSPVFTGVPTAPTAGVATNNTQIATTAFVRTLAGSQSGVVGYNSNTTLSNSNAGQLSLSQSGTPTLTLPVPADARGSDRPGRVLGWPAADHLPSSQAAWRCAPRGRRTRPAR